MSNSNLTQAIERWHESAHDLTGNRWLAPVFDAAKSWRVLYEPCSTCGGDGEVGNWRENPEPCPDCAFGEQPTTKAVKVFAGIFKDAGHDEPFASQYATAALLELRRQL